MTAKLRVFVVDDAVIVRRMIAQALGRDPGIEVIGTASDGDVALANPAIATADVVVLDIEMPTMDGFETLKELRRRWPQLPVVMFTGVSEPGPAELEALALGADDVVQKLPHEGNMVNALDWVLGHLAPRLKQIVEQRAARPKPAKPATSRPATSSGSTAPATPARVRSVATEPAVLLIGASTGGPDALEQVIRRLPADYPLPILVVQHMPEGFTRLLAERLSARTPFVGAEAVDGAVLAAGRVWVAPGDRHMVMARSGDRVVLQTNREPHENSCRPAVDVLFRSAAALFGARTLAVILTGMGYDGMKGAEAIVLAGGQVLAQDEATSVVWGMPGAVVRAGLASRVLPLTDLAEEILQRTAGGRLPAVRS